MNEKAKKEFRCEIVSDECKGCGRCVEACPKGLIVQGTKLNLMSFPSAVYKGSGCIGCGGCYYSCPEPGAIRIIEIIHDEE